MCQLLGGKCCEGYPGVGFEGTSANGNGGGGGQSDPSPRGGVGDASGGGGGGHGSAGESGSICQKHDRRGWWRSGGKFSIEPHVYGWRWWCRRSR